MGSTPRGAHGKSGWHFRCAPCNRAATCRARPLRSAASASPVIDHPQEMILAKWAQHPGFIWGGRSWKIWVACAVCSLKPEGCTHCVLLRAPRRLLTNHKETLFIQWAQHSRVGELMENPGGVCGWGWGLLENTEEDMRCAF